MDSIESNETKATLDSLPAELFIVITDHLPKLRHVVCLALASRAMYVRVQPVLNHLKNRYSTPSLPNYSRNNLNKFIDQLHVIPHARAAVLDVTISFWSPRTHARLFKFFRDAPNITKLDLAVPWGRAEIERLEGAFMEDERSPLQHLTELILRPAPGQRHTEYQALWHFLSLPELTSVTAYELDESWNFRAWFADIISFGDGPYGGAKLTTLRLPQRRIDLRHVGQLMSSDCHSMTTFQISVQRAEAMAQWWTALGMRLVKWSENSLNELVLDEMEDEDEWNEDHRLWHYYADGDSGCQPGARVDFLHELSELEILRLWWWMLVGEGWYSCMDEIKLDKLVPPTVRVLDLRMALQTEGEAKRLAYLLGGLVDARRDQSKGLKLSIMVQRKAEGVEDAVFEELANGLQKRAGFETGIEVEVRWNKIS